MKLDIKQRKGKMSENIILLLFISLLTLWGANLLFNSWISDGPRVFYADDLGCLLDYNSVENGFDFIFGTGANKVRPLTYAAIYFTFYISNGQYEIIDEILLGLNFLNTVLVFFFTYWLQKNEQYVKRITISLICGILFIASRFAYYNISEVLGIMESLGVFFSISILFLLMLFTETERKKHYYCATILYAAVLYTHERYFVLFTLFLVAILLLPNDFSKNYKLLISPFLLLVSFWMIRFLLFGGRSFDGTGGTDIKETFNFFNVLKFYFSQIGYILGFQCGPQYLSGIDALHVSKYINFFLCIRIIAILWIFILFSKLLISNNAFRKMHLNKCVLFLTFIALCIASSSITIRVEMRWIYVSYTAFLIMIFWMIYTIPDQYNINIARKSSLLVIFLITLFVEQYYRGYYVNLYYWEEKDLSRELYEVTIGKYGTDFEGKHLIILGQNKNDDCFSDEDYWKSFFSPYINSENLKISYMNSANQVRDNISSNNIILFKDLESRKYVDVTSAFASNTLEPKINYKYGIYEDGWCEPDCEFEVDNYIDENLLLSFYYPDDMEPYGETGGTIIINNTDKIKFSLTGNFTTIKIELPQQEKNTVQIVSDYWVYENTDRSINGKLSSVLQINAVQ